MSLLFKKVYPTLPPSNLSLKQHFLFEKLKPTFQSFFFVVLKLERNLIAWASHVELHAEQKSPDLSNELSKPALLCTAHSVSSTRHGFGDIFGETPLLKIPVFFFWLFHWTEKNGMDTKTRNLKTTTFVETLKKCFHAF